MVSALSIIIFITIVTFTSLAAIQKSGLWTVVAAAMFFASLFVAAYSAALGALGGFLVDHFAKNYV